MTSFHHSTQFLPVGALILTAAIHAEEPASAMASFPENRAPLREMTTDRPDKTESPFTVNAGHAQIESDLVNWSRDLGPERVESLEAAAFNFRLGITETLEINVIGTAYQRETRRSPMGRTRSEGFGDLTLRLKHNVHGNDDGPSAFALMPFVTLPTASADLGVADVEAGLILPWSFDLGNGWGIGLMGEIDFTHNQAGNRTVHLIGSVTLAKEVTDRTGLYAEFFSEIPTGDSSDWAGTVDCGVTYALTENLQLDAGINIGLTRAADDLNPFVGVSFRY